MGKSKKCPKKDDSSSCPSSSSSSSSSCDSSSSSSCYDSSDESSECFNPCKYKQSPICPKKIKTMNMETCLISYKKRVLEVGDCCRYKTIDEALSKVRPNKGGYIIKLKPGIHFITRDCCNCTDDLTIVGDDCCAFAGFFYMQGGNHHVTPDFEACQELCPYDKDIGEGPFIITSSNRRFLVKGNISPNFDCLCQGRSVGIVHTDGSITQGEIIRVCGNTISVNADTGFGDDANSGEGFFFYPNVILSAGVENIHITTTGRLTFEGVVFDGSNFTLGSSGNSLVLRNCVSEVKPHLHITGRYEFLSANTFLGTVYLSPSSSGTSFYQSVVGKNANLLMDSSGFHSWKYGFFCSTNVGIKMVNSAEACLKGSQFINNSQGISANGGCNCTIYSTYFYGNIYAVVGINRCFFSSNPADNSPSTNYIPIFRENNLVFIANIMTMIIVANATIENNTNYAIIDSTSYPTVETNYAGQFGRAFSLIIDSANIGNAQASELDLFNTIITSNTLSNNTAGGPTVTSSTMTTNLGGNTGFSTNTNAGTSRFLL